MEYELSRGNYGVSRRTEHLISGSGASKYKFDISSGELLLEAKNIMLSDGCMRSIAPKREICTISEKYSGEEMIKAKCESDGITLMRINNSLYAKDKTAALRRISSNCFSSDRTLIFYLDGCFYATNGGKILKITKNYKITTVEYYVPTIYTGLTSYGLQGVEYESPNVVCDYVYLEYTTTSSFSSLKFPKGVSVDGVESIKNKSNGSTVYRYTLEKVSNENYISFSNSKSAGTYIVKAKLGSGSATDKASLSAFAAARGVLFSSSMICELDVETDKHGSFFGICNDNESFYVFNASSLSYITSDMIWCTPIGVKPTAMVEYSDGELVFSSSKIVFVKPTITDSDSKPSVNISKTIVKRDFGCDMPGSAVAFDNKIIFGNSSNGIFFIDKFGLSERDGSCIVSMPIKERFFGFDTTALKAAHAICTGSAYYISIGDTLMALSFESGAPRSTSESYDERMRYSWTEISDASSCEFVSVVGNDVYILEHDDVKERMISNGGGDMSSVIKSRALDLGTHAEKVMSGICLIGAFGGEVVIRLAYDGKMSDTIYKITPSDGEMRLYRAVTPRMRFCFAEIWISCASSAVIKGIEAEYYTV